MKQVIKAPRVIFPPGAYNTAGAIVTQNPMPKRRWIDYVLRKLEFANGAVLGFRGAVMLYREDNRGIAIEHPDWSTQDIDASLREIANADGTLPPIKTIFYDMKIEGVKNYPMFFHPLKREANVRLLPREKGRTVLFFEQADGRTIFSKDFTLRDVTQGAIDSDQAVWQFHGYKHEH